MTPPATPHPLRTLNPRAKSLCGLLNGLFVCGVLGFAPGVFAADKIQDTLTPKEIFPRAVDKYASLTSYSDEGETVALVNGTTLTSKFTIKLARPNLYKVEWARTTDSWINFLTKPKPQAVWSAGAGDFLDMGIGVQKQASQEMALASATGISGGAAATVPGTFFKMNWGNALGTLGNGMKQQQDEQVGGSACYVFGSEMSGVGTTIWIGREDFLVHQVRHVTSAEAMKEALDNAAKVNPGAPRPGSAPSGITSTETHTNIVLNAKIDAASFGR